MLLGPSGCGKSTLRTLWPAYEIRRRPGVFRRAGRDLYCAAGAGHRHGVPVLRPLPAPERARGTSRSGASCAAAPRERGRAPVEEVAGSLGLETLLDRLPAPSPAGSGSGWPWAGRSCAMLDVFLFDEPLSNLDAQLRSSCGWRSSGSTGAWRRPCLRHPRSGRGDDARRPGGGDDGPGDPAGGNPLRRSTAGRPTASSPAFSARRP